MKTNHLLFYLLICIVLCSCHYEFELDDLNTSEKLVLYCMPCADRDTTLIQLSKSRPVSQKGTAAHVSDARISFTVNGEEQTVHRAETELPSVPARCYYVIGRWKENDVIRMEAEADGLPPVSAQTTIPAGFPLEKVSLMLKPTDYSSTLQFCVTFRDPSETDNYYGIRLMEEVYHEYMETDEDGLPHLKKETNCYVIAPDLDDEPLLNNQSGLNEIFDMSNNYLEDLYIWSDELIQGKEYTLRLNTYYRPDYESDDDSEYTRSLTHRYKASLYALSPEMYRFLKSLNEVHNNELGTAGLAPIRSHYTNVKNGIGVLGGCRIMGTEWMKNLLDK